MLQEDVGPILCVELNRSHELAKWLVHHHAMWIVFEPIGLANSLKVCFTEIGSHGIHIVD